MHALVKGWKRMFLTGHWLTGEKTHNNPIYMQVPRIQPDTIVTV